MSTQTAATNTITLGEAKKHILECIKNRLVPFTQSSPGIGKSAIHQEIADENNLLLIDYRISSADPTDFNGFPTVDPVRNVATYVPFDTFPVAHTPLPDKVDAQGNVIGKYDGWLLLMDELNHGNPTILRAAYKLILDKKVGQYHLHPRVAICAAGNLATDNAHTNKLGSALDSRVIQLFVKNDAKEWLVHANKQNWDYRITSFIGFKNEAVNNFTPDTKPGPFACQRTWEFTHRLIKNIPTLDPSHVGLVAGAIGEGMARELIGFTRVFQDLPSFQDIISNPNSAKVPTTPDCQYAIAGLLASNSDTTTLNAIMTYIGRIPTEFQVLTLKDVLRRKPDLINHEKMQKWVEDNADAVA